MKLFPIVIATVIQIVSLSIAEVNGVNSCSTNPCENGGQCEDITSGFVCHCPLQYVGDKCQFEAGVVDSTMCLVSSPPLDSNALCEKAVDGSDTAGLQTEWVINGTYGGIGAYIVLHLVQRYNVIGIKYRQRCDPQKQFQKLAVTLNDGTMELADATCSSVDTCNDDKWETVLSDTAKPDIYLIKITILAVCTGVIQTNIGFRDISVLTSLDECTLNNPCLNNGVCNEEDIGYNCDCSGTGFDGEHCEHNIDDCVGITCVNGVCSDLVNDAECICDAGFEGDFCEIDINDCDPNPCIHGSCADQVNGYTCNCDPGYEGDDCETDIDECDGVVCQNGGSCVDEVNSYSCLCADGTAGQICTEPEDLECRCRLNGSSLQLDVFDEPDLIVYSEGQKTILSSYKMFEHDPCKFKFQVVTTAASAPAPILALAFNVGKHTRNPKKTARSYKMYGPDVIERGVNKSGARITSFPYCWASPDQSTELCIDRVGDIFQFRSTTCPYALDVIAANGTLTGTLYVEQDAFSELIGMCGDCDDLDNGYVLADGTSVDDVADPLERTRLITESYQDWGAKRSRRDRN